MPIIEGTRYYIIALNTFQRSGHRYVLHAANSINYYHTETIDKLVRKVSCGKGQRALVKSSLRPRFKCQVYASFKTTKDTQTLLINFALSKF